jgi:glycosyltransferase involved in cell wall biosynthesis
MTNPGTVLVLTPTLGESAFLDQTVASVAAQSVPILHVLSVPAAKAEAVQRRFKHTLVVPDAGRAGGIYGALNAGLQAAPPDWEWFTYINDDDVLLPGFSDLVRRQAGGPGGGVAYGEVDLLDESDAILTGITIERNPRRLGALLQSGISPLMQQGTLFSRAAVVAAGKFDLRYRLCADLDFWLRCWASGQPFTYHRMRVAQFRLRAGQLSGDTARTRAEQDEIVRRHLPLASGSAQRAWAVARFRVDNLPKYLRRFRRNGLQTSYAILGGGSQQKKPA